MTTSRTNFQRAVDYLSLTAPHVQIKSYLGGGTDGEVWQTSEETAIKVFKYDFGYFNERDTYERLKFFGVVESIDGFWIPRMLNCDDELMVVEMDIMQHPPYIIDFAKVKLNSSPDFPPDILEHQERQGVERFEHNWPAVRSLMATLESLQIYYLDPQRGNITFPDMP